MDTTITIHQKGLDLSPILSILIRITSIPLKEPDPTPIAIKFINMIASLTWPKEIPDGGGLIAEPRRDAEINKNKESQLKDSISITTIGNGSLHSL